MDAALVTQAGAARDALLRGDELRAIIERVPLADRDPFVDEVLGLPPMPDDAELPQGAVPYLPCAVDDILAAIRVAAIAASDTFIDLGSGIGRVTMLVNLLVGARAHGLELQPQLVELARDHAAKLGLDRVTFECRDVRELSADRQHVGDGTRFVLFLFAPFNGEMLSRALEAIGEFARGRDVTMCTVAMQLGEVRGFRREPAARGTVAIYRSEVGR